MSHPAKPAPTRTSPKPTGPAQYLRWLGILCAVMAAFCVGVLVIGYKEPSFGRIATLVLLCIASPLFLWLAKRKG